MIIRKFNSAYQFIFQLSERIRLVRSKLEEESKSSSILVKYKIATSYDDYKRTGKLLLQSKRGGAYCYMTPEQLCCDEKLISSMHPLDVAIVTKLQLEEEEAVSTSHIVKQWASAEHGETVYLIYNSFSDEHITVRESELIDLPNIVQRLSVKDCMSIGFGMGVKHSKRVAELQGNHTRVQQ